MNIWIPKKCQIEFMLLKTANRLKQSGSVNEIEKWLDDELCVISAHISNRAAVERGEITSNYIE